MLYCGGVVNDTKDRITAPDYDNNALYDDNLNCSWTLINYNDSLKIELIVHVEDIECDYDYIEVMNS